MRQENFQSLIDKPSTPLVASGPVGPPHIVEIPESVTVGESSLSIYLSYFLLDNSELLKNTAFVLRIGQIKSMKIYN